MPVEEERTYAGYNSLNALCPSRQVLSLIADRWTVLTLFVLSCEGLRPKRYGEIKRTIEGISQKMLTQTLRQLEENGLVNRTVYPVIPPKVEYELTALGQTLLNTMLALKTWAETHMPEVEAARERFRPEAV